MTMWKSKPTKPEDLYEFFIKGVPLKSLKQDYGYTLGRKGWNVNIYHVDAYNKEYIYLEFYSAINAYYPDWTLKAYKYVDTETK